jgi:hypothetical protein
MAKHRWRPWHLLLSWCAYWISLVAITLGRPLLAIWRVGRSAEGHGTISAGFTNAVAHLSIVEDGRTVWSGAAHVVTIALWFAGPPLLLWLAYVMQRRPRPTTAELARISEQSALRDGSRPALRAADEAVWDRLGDQRDAAPPARRRDHERSE